MMLFSSFCAVLESLSTTPQTRNRLPSISIPISEVASGRIRQMTMETITGKRICSVLETGRSCSILTALSFFVVQSFMIGGWMKGTSAIYEYAAMAIAPSSAGASVFVT